MKEVRSTGAVLSHECFLLSVDIKHGAEPTQDTGIAARGRREWMVPVKPITTCEFIPMLRRCKPLTGWPKKLGMNTACPINDSADNIPS